MSRTFRKNQSKLSLGSTEHWRGDVRLKFPFVCLSEAQGMGCMAVAVRRTNGGATVLSGFCNIISATSYWVDAIDNE